MQSITYKKPLLMILVILLTLATASVASADETAQYQQKIDGYQQKINTATQEQTAAQGNLSRSTTDFENMKAKSQAADNTYTVLKKQFDAAVQNPDNMDVNKVASLSQQMKTAKETRDQLNVQLAQKEAEKNNYAGQVQRLTNDIQGYRTSMNNAYADAFDYEFKKPQWVDGEAAVTISEDKSKNDCIKLATDYARRDAMERGGGMIISAVTETNMFEVTKDQVKTSVKVVILREDTSNGYGKPQIITKGDFQVVQLKVRLLVQNASGYNPYREKAIIPAAVAAAAPVVAAVSGGNNVNNNYNNVINPLNSNIANSSKTNSDNSIADYTSGQSDDWNNIGIHAWLGLGGYSNSISESNESGYIQNYTFSSKSTMSPGFNIEVGAKTKYFGARIKYARASGSGTFTISNYSATYIYPTTSSASAFYGQAMVIVPIGQFDAYGAIGYGANTGSMTINAPTPQSSTSDVNFIPISFGADWNFYKYLGLNLDCTIIHYTDQSNANSVFQNQVLTGLNLKVMF
ncbi:MAG: hypothetical protein WCP79_02350 [Bacillota bacterium]